MKPLVRLGYLAAVCALLVTTFAIIGPRTAHALVATLVQVVNTSANPVPTQVVNNPARQAVVLTIAPGLIIPDGQFAVIGPFKDVSGPYTVPAGMRLVVESTSGIINLPTGQKPFFFRLTVSVNEVEGLLHPELIFVASSSGVDTYEWLAQSTTYADPGTQVSAFCNRFPYSTGTGTCFATLSGHLESIN